MRNVGIVLPGEGGKMEKTNNPKNCRLFPLEPPVYASLPHTTQSRGGASTVLRSAPTLIYVIQMIRISSNAFLFPSRALLLITTILNISKSKPTQLLISRTTVCIVMSIVTQAPLRNSQAYLLTTK